VRTRVKVVRRSGWLSLPVAPLQETAQGGVAGSQQRLTSGLLTPVDLRQYAAC
jgi:hypothetical protein